MATTYHCLEAVDSEVALNLAVGCMDHTEADLCRRSEDAAPSSLVSIQALPGEVPEVEEGDTSQNRQLRERGLQLVDWWTICVA